MNNVSNWKYMGNFSSEFSFNFDEWSLKITLRRQWHITDPWSQETSRNSASAQSYDLIP